jgi:DNA-damage-inducible protein J
MELVTVNVRMDKNIKNEAETLFAELGINMSTAINMFVRQAVRQNKIPFEISAEKAAEPERKDRRAAFGCLKGKIHVPDDFNEPLDDFKEYMQ